MADYRTEEQKSPIVLDYHNSLLRQSDVDLLDQPNWINDNIIGFAFEYFEKEQFSHSVDLIGYISPSVTQAIKFSSPEEVCIFLDPLKLHEKQYIFMAVNDQMSVTTHGGTHWSLLVCDRNQKEFHHYDSLRGSNRNIAKFLAEKLFTYFTVNAPEKSSQEKAGPQEDKNINAPEKSSQEKAGPREDENRPEKFCFQQKPCPQQENSYDCGMYVIIVCEHLIRTFVEACMLPLETAITMSCICKRRQNLKELIYQLKS